MSDAVSASDDDSAMAEEVGRLLLDRGRWIGVSESLTGGLLVQALARVEGSGDWLTGGVVAYASTVKRDLLGVTAYKVVSRKSAMEMASGARRRLGADVAVSVTGVAGPDPQDGEPPGTVWIGLDDGLSVTAEPFITSGSASEVCAQTVSEALRRVVGALRPV
jgi:nicotinamide-nucleotide amidase